MNNLCQRSVQKGDKQDQKKINDKFLPLDATTKVQPWHPTQPTAFQWHLLCLCSSTCPLMVALLLLVLRHHCCCCCCSRLPPQNSFHCQIQRPLVGVTMAVQARENFHLTKRLWPKKLRNTKKLKTIFILTRRDICCQKVCLKKKKSTRKQYIIGKHKSNKLKK